MKNLTNLTRPIVAILIAACACPIIAQDSPLFANGIDDWDTVNATAGSFNYSDGVLRVSGSDGWLRSPREYGNFELRGQVRFVEADADSGIFLRVESGTDFIRGWPGDAYQVQMREISVNTSDNPLPLLNLYRHRVGEGTTRYQRERVFALYTGVGEWQDFTIRVDGTILTVQLNGQLVLEANNLENASGYLGFQSETGVIEYRNLVLREL
jgi:hypothetical protein